MDLGRMLVIADAVVPGPVVNKGEHFGAAQRDADADQISADYRLRIASAVTILAAETTGSGWPGSALLRWAQPLTQKVPLVIRRVVEASKLLITQLFVEAACLKAERVQPCRVAAPLDGKGLRPTHQFPSHPFAAQFLGYPEVLHE